MSIGDSWAAVGAVVACLLAGCSSGSERSDESGGTSAATATSSTAAAGGDAQWTTNFHDAARSGLAEDGPTAGSETAKLWESSRLDGDVYAQPLVVGDRVIVATGNDTVYALDVADGDTLWDAHLGDPVPRSSLPCGNVDPVGVTGTPVVDPDSGRVYVVGMVEPGRHVLFELDLSSGEVLDSTRVDAKGADPLVHNQRAALTLSNDTVFVPYGGRFGDCGDYRGRVVSIPVDPSGLGRPASFALPTQGRGGFWAPPGATLASDGSPYLASGNSSSDGTYDYGNSVVRLSPDLELADSCAPDDWVSLNAGDIDLGSTSPVLLSGGRVFQVGKAGTGYLLDAGHLGGIGAEVYSAPVCDGASFGGSAHDGDTLFVPCGGAVVQVTVGGDRFTVGWTAQVSTPGPTIVTDGAVWDVATGKEDLIALDPGSGDKIWSGHIGTTPSRFTSAAAGGGRVVVAAGRRVQAFG
jgi:outer membrane protein assembly factor BamB